MAPRERELLGVVAAAGASFPTQASERFGEILADYGRAAKRNDVAEALVRLGKTPLLVTNQLDTNVYNDVAAVPAALWPRLPALLAPLIPGLEELPAAATGSTRYTQPRRLLDAALQMLLTIELAPPERAPRTPRPLLEDQLTWLREWEYDPVELAAVAANGKLHKDHQLLLTTPPPPRSLTAAHLDRFAPLLGSDIGADFLFALLEQRRAGHAGQPGERP